MPFLRFRLFFGIAPVLVFLFVRLALPLLKSWHSGKDPY